MKIFFYFFFLFSIFKYFYCEGTSCFEYSCEECDPDDRHKCTKCRDGFQLVDGKCPCSDFRCALCPTGLYDFSICELCKDGYYRYKNKCMCDIEGCSICQNNICLLCDNDYILNSGRCEKQTSANRIRNCFDSNCDICASEADGACEECKSGYKLSKGVCSPLDSVNPDGTCNDGYYKEDNYCKQKCEGLDCTQTYIKDNQYIIHSACSENNCLVCQENELRYIPSCNSFSVCGSEECLLCISNDDCYACQQGYYVEGGFCKRCINGCSKCNDDTSCQYCLSGYELDANGHCNYNSNKYDFNVNLYQKKKFQLILQNFPDEFNLQEAQTYSSISECDSHCSKCEDRTSKCLQCNTLYKLINNKCIMSCSDENCIKCSIPLISEHCDQCKAGYSPSGKNCLLKCSDENCRYCTKINNQEICTECIGKYKLDGNKCKSNSNYMVIIYAIIVFLVLAIFIICFCWYKQKKINERHEIIRNVIAQRNLENVTVYNRNYEEESANRIPITKEMLLEEFEKQKIKIEKGSPMCQFCKKKAGKYKCDCECIVCKEHSQLKEEQGDGGSYKVCFNCGKIVKKVTQIKQQCNICFEKKLTLVHFQCNCALLVCKNCFIKCKMESDKCPGCRAKI